MVRLSGAQDSPTLVLPHLGGYSRRTGPGGDAGNFFATSEWGAGGITHLHALLRLTGSPRIDKAPRENLVEGESDNEDMRLDSEYVEEVADFCHEYISEIHPSKAETG